MSLFSNFGVSIDTVKLLAIASKTASGGPAPSGWSVYTRFDDPKTGASATVMRSGDSYIVAFRATDDALDRAQYPLLADGRYIKLFDSLLSALPSGAKYYVTGASLGGGAANQLADIASSAYGGKFANASFVAFASPNISSSSKIMNFGFDNDPVFKMINNYRDFASSLDNLALANGEYMAGNYDGRQPYSWGAHEGGVELFDRLAESRFYERMHADSPVIFVATSGLVQDQDPSRGSVGAFYLGTANADFIVGRAGNDFLEGFRGSDRLEGGAGNDHIAGGAGDDVIEGGTGTDTAVYAGVRSNYSVTRLADGSLEIVDLRSGSPDGKDRVRNVEAFQFADRVYTADELLPVTTSTDTTSTITTTMGDQVLTGDAGANTLTGGAGHDRLDGKAGNDKLYGLDGNDVLIGGAGADLLDGGAGTDTASYETATAGLTADLMYASNNTGDAHGDSYVSIENLTGSAYADTLRGNDAANVLTGGDGADKLYGRGGNDTLDGGAGNDYLDGGAGNDILRGGDGNDTLFGGSGADALWGGAGSDIFVFKSSADSAPTARDTIHDFVSGVDKIDLRSIDANTNALYDQAFSFIGGSAFSGKAGQLNFVNGVLSGDTNGDKVADFQINITNVSSLATTDFYL